MTNLVKFPFNAGAMTDLFLNFPFKRDRDPFFNLSSWSNMPTADLRENNESYVIELDVPGITSDEIDIDYDKKEEILNIKINRTEEKEDRTSRYHIKERICNNLHRTFHLPQIDENAIDAKLNNGVLKITSPKTNQKPIKSEKIKINQT